MSWVSTRVTNSLCYANQTEPSGAGWMIRCSVPESGVSTLYHSKPSLAASAPDAIVRTKPPRGQAADRRPQWELGVAELDCRARTRWTNPTWANRGQRAPNSHQAARFLGQARPSADPLGRSGPSGRPSFRPHRTGDLDRRQFIDMDPVGYGLRRSHSDQEVIASVQWDEYTPVDHLRRPRRRTREHAPVLSRAISSLSNDERFLTEGRPNRRDRPIGDDRRRWRAPGHGHDDDLVPVGK